MVSTVGSDLSGLATAIHGATQKLLESLGDPSQTQQSAGDLWAAATRLQHFGRKLLCYHPPTGSDPVEPTDVVGVLSQLQREYREDTMGSLRIDLHVAPDVPAVLSEASALAHSVRFLLDGLLSLEPRAQQVFVGVTHSFEEGGSSVQLELRVEAEGGTPTPFATQRLELGYRAAQHLLHRTTGRVSLTHRVGTDTAAFIQLQATADEPTSPAPSTTCGLRNTSHHYGGVLVLEADPVLRAMIATELRLAERSFSTCADGASARALLEATPERFELVIAERDARLVSGDELLGAAFQRFPELKGLLIQDGLAATPDPLLAAAGRCAVLAKPFEAQDLRQSLSQLLRGSD